MSDNVPFRIQEACADYYMVDVFSNVRPAAIGGTKSRHQLAMYVTRASEDSGRLDILQKLRGDPNIMKIFSDSFRWEKTQGEKIIGRLSLEDFHAENEIERKKIDYMKLAENVVFTLPVSDASIMQFKGKLLNEHGELILDMGEIDADLLTGGETRAGEEHECIDNEPVEQEPVEQDVAI